MFLPALDRLPSTPGPTTFHPLQQANSSCLNRYATIVNPRVICSSSKLRRIFNLRLTYYLYTTYANRNFFRSPINEIFFHS